MTRDNDADEEIPGGYNTVEGIKERAQHFGNPVVATLIDNAESRIYECGDGYRIENPSEDSGELEMLFHFGILTGAALEREYPAPGSESE